jgi:Cu/Ag efflux pump CusA
VIRWLIGSSMRARGFVLVVAAIVVGLGVWQVRDAKVDTLPEFTPPTVQIQTEALGLSAPEVEQLITVPLEQDLLAGVPWLDSIRSSSIPGLSSVELIFEQGTDILRARQMVEERLTQAAGLPNVSGPPQMLQPLSSTSRIMMLRLTSATVSPIEMSVLARWTIRPKLLGVPGVGNVSTFGQRERQLQVQVDPDLLRRQGLSLDDVIETSGNALWASPLTFLEASTPGTGGFIDTAQQRLGIQHLQPITTASDLAEVPIRTSKGNSLQLGDVAAVVEDHQPLIGDAIFTDGQQGLLLVIEKLPGANTLEVTRGLEDAVAALRPGLSGVNVDTTVYRPATYIEQSSRNLDLAFLLALLLVILALGALLWEWRSALVALVAILTSMATAWLVLYLRHTTANHMILVGLVMALVVIVDDAVTDTVHAVRSLRAARMNGMEPKAPGVLREALVETRTSLAFATAMTILVVVPLFFVQGEVAPFMPPMLLSFVLAAFASIVVALLVTPAIAVMLLPGVRPERRDAPAMAWLARGYDRAMAAVLAHRRRVYAGAGVVALVGMMIAPFLVGTALPSFRDGNVLIDVQAMPGTSLPEMDRITDRIGAEIAAVPGVAEVGAHIGRAIRSDQVVGVDAAQLWVSIDPDADYDEVVAGIGGVANGYPGIANSVRTYSDERIARVLSRTDSPIVVRLYGQDLGSLQEQASQVIERLLGINGIADPRVELQPQEPTVDVRVDLAKAERVGVVPGDVRRAAATMMSGIGVGSLFEQQKVFEVVVWGTPETRNSIGSVRALQIDTADGGHVPLGRVADVSIASTPTVIRHQDLSRSLDITADVRGRDVDAVAADVHTLLAGMTFPLEYHAELVGDYAAHSAAIQRAIWIAIAAALGIFLLLQAALSSWRLALGAFLVLPLALSGCLLAAAVTGGVASIGTAMGGVAVLALSLRTGVITIRHGERLQWGTSATFDEHVVRRCARDRMPPTVIAAVVIVTAMLPFALSGAVAGEEILQPMAIAVIGGVLVSALLNLFVVPAFYLGFGSTAVPDAATDEEIITVPEIETVSAGSEEES